MIKNSPMIVEVASEYKMRALSTDYFFPADDEFEFLDETGQSYASMTHYLACRQLTKESDKSTVQALPDAYAVRQHMMALGFNRQEGTFVYPHMSLDEVEELTRAYGLLFKNNSLLKSRLVGQDPAIFVKNAGPICGPLNLFYGATLVADNWIGVNVIGKIISLYQRRLRKPVVKDWDIFVDNTVEVMRDWYISKEFIVK